MTAAPPVSVIMTTYNHEAFIAEAVQSVLDQTFPDFELIVVDDGSTDKTGDIIKGFSDSRIIYIKQKNQGPSMAFNNGLNLAKGKYVAIFSGDDVCYPNRLERQYSFFTKGDQDRTVLFSWCDFIDDNSQPIEGEHFALSYFNHPNRTSAEILNHFFREGNYFCAPSAMLPKAAIETVGRLLITSLQLQDWDLWIKLLKNDYQLEILPESLIKYRIRSDSENLSSPSNSVRSTFEAFQLWETFFDGFSMDMFKQVFLNDLKNPNFSTTAEFELEKAFIYLTSPHLHIKNIGVKKLFNLLQHSDLLKLVEEKYSFHLSDFFELTATQDITNSVLISSITEQNKNSTLAYEKLESQLEESQAQLQDTQNSLAKYQSELKASQLDLEKAQVQLEQTRLLLEQAQSRANLAEEHIEIMKSSKFWKLRNLWFRLKPTVRNE